MRLLINPLRKSKMSRFGTAGQNDHPKILNTRKRQPKKHPIDVGLRQVKPKTPKESVSSQNLKKQFDGTPNPFFTSRFPPLFSIRRIFLKAFCFHPKTLISPRQATFSLASPRGHSDGKDVLSGRGSKYEGEYQNDFRHGHGTLTWPDGGRSPEGDLVSLGVLVVSLVFFLEWFLFFSRFYIVVLNGFLNVFGWFSIGFRPILFGGC